MELLRRQGGSLGLGRGDPWGWAGGILGVGQAGAVGEVCGGSRRGMSWGDAARSSWSGIMRPGNFLDRTI